MKKYVVYLHKNKSNGKCYVGITSIKPENRWSNGEGYKGCTAFYGAIKKYGWHNFSHEILYTDLSREDASNMEKRLIVEYNSRVPHGYNLESGGVDNVEFSENTRKKISASLKGKKCSESKRSILREKNLGNRNPNYGKKTSDSTKKKMSEAHIGNVNFWLHKKVGKFDFNGNLIDVYESLTDASEKMGVCLNAIGNCVKVRSKSNCGFIWKYI